MAIEQYYFPTEILYGRGAVAEFAKRVAQWGHHGGRPLLLVTDPGIVEAGLTRVVMSHLIGAGLRITIHSAVHQNPIEADVDKGVELFNDCEARAIVALGGGSPMDVAKAVAVRATHDGPMSRFDRVRHGAQHIVRRLPPIYAIPTTAGTGSEVSATTMIVCANSGVKTAIYHPQLMPRLAVLDPDLVAELPAHMTLCSGMIAFVQGLEAYLARGDHPMADAIALGCIELVSQHLPRLIEHGHDLDSRGRMLLAASMSGTAMQKGLGMIRSLAHPLCTRYGMHLGVASALLMPVVLGWQIEHLGDRMPADLRLRYTRLARRFGRETAEDLPDATAALNARLGIGTPLAACGLTADDIPELVRQAYADPFHQGSPVAVTREVLRTVYERCL